jgi:hypothetical protein
MIGTELFGIDIQLWQAGAGAAWTVASAWAGWLLRKRRENAELAKLWAETSKLNEEVSGLRETGRKTREETAKLKNEVVQSALIIVQKLQDSRKAWEDESTQCGQLAKQLNNEMLSGATLEEVDTLREECCACLLERVLPRLRDYTEMVVASDPPESACAFMRDFIPHELTRYRQWLSVFNSESILRHLPGKTTAKIHAHSLQSFDAALQRLPTQLREQNNVDMAYSTAKLALISPVAGSLALPAPNDEKTKDAFR